MGALKSVPDRLREVKPYCTDPEPLWEMRQICAAFKVPSEKATKLIPKGCKKRQMLNTVDWRFRICVTLINRAGVEALALRYSREHTRGELMAALDASVKGVVSG